MKGVMKICLLFAVFVAVTVSMATENESSNDRAIGEEDLSMNEVRAAALPDDDDDDLTEQEADEILNALATKREADDDGDVNTVKRGWRRRLRRVWRRHKTTIIYHGAKALLGKKR